MKSIVTLGEEGNTPPRRSPGNSPHGLEIWAYGHKILQDACDAMTLEGTLVTDAQVTTGVYVLGLIKELDPSMNEAGMHYTMVATIHPDGLISIYYPDYLSFEDVQSLVK